MSQDSDDDSKRLRSSRFSQTYSHASQKTRRWTSSVQCLQLGPTHQETMIKTPMALAREFDMMGAVNNLRCMSCFHWVLFIYPIVQVHSKVKKSIQSSCLYSDWSVMILVYDGPESTFSRTLTHAHLHTIHTTLFQCQQILQYPVSQFLALEHAPMESLLGENLPG